MKNLFDSEIFNALIILAVLGLPVYFIATTYTTWEGWKDSMLYFVLPIFIISLPIAAVANWIRGVNEFWDILFATFCGLLVLAWFVPYLLRGLAA